MIPQTLAVISALFPLLLIGGIVATIIWSVGTTFEPELQKRRATRRAVRALIETGYMKLRAVCEPDTLDQAHSHNMALLKADARDHVNLIIPFLSGNHPEVCTTDNDSLQAWFAILAKLRMERGLAKQVVEEASG